MWLFLQVMVKCLIGGLAFLAVTASGTVFTSCTADDKLGIKTVHIEPYNPITNDHVQVEMDGHTSVEMLGGEAEVMVKVLGIQVFSENLDLCTQLGLTCPIEAGTDFKMVLSYQVPEFVDFTPGGGANVELQVKDQSGETLSCVDVEVNTSDANSSGQFVAIPEHENIRGLFEAWRNDFKMEFETGAEHGKRLGVFASNHAHILQHNSNSGASYTLAHNQFSHLTLEEFSALNIRGWQDTEVEQMDGGWGVNVTTAPVPDQKSLMTLPQSVDWRKEGAVTKVKHQQHCGSCWAFSTTGAVEGAYFLKTGNLTSFSEQELVDCDMNDHGCKGGSMHRAFSYVRTHGLASEREFPYHPEQDATCGASKKPRALPKGLVTGYVRIQSGNEWALMHAVSKRPVSVAIEADQRAFQFYSRGVLSGDCGHRLDHGVLAVGYGIDPHHPLHEKYWIVKNSWGKRWGDHGYIRIERLTNKCGIANSGCFPKTD